ncbi:MAG: hypothetical protein JST92_24275, partial [Deltaproteobacteria bacterium]|nr:hypothetical protein [Deltaproteobacteria bacterium]
MKTTRLLPCLALALSGVLACGGSDTTGGNDAGTQDSGAVDSGTDAGGNDAGGTDSGTSDSGTADSGTADSGTEDSGTADAGADAGTDAGTADAGSDAGTDAGTSDAGTDGGTVTAECDKAENVAKKNALIAAQPVLGVRSKSTITADATFASVAGNASVNCTVSLHFKDSNGNGTLDAYEDWTRSADERAADLVGRLTSDQKLALMIHATPDDPTSSVQTVSTALQTKITAGVRFAATQANSVTVTKRATWANNVQAAAEATALGIPFVLSSEPNHSAGNGRAKAAGFSQWPQEAGLGATGDLTLLESYGKVVATEYRAIGITLALSASADLATEPRWFGSQFTFGEDSASVSALAGAYVKGLQGTSLASTTSVAAIVGHFPGAGAASSGWDGRLAKGKFLVYPGKNLDAHLNAFQGALANHAAGVMPAYGIVQTGSF